MIMRTQITSTQIFLALDLLVNRSTNYNKSFLKKGYFLKAFFCFSMSLTQFKGHSELFMVVTLCFPSFSY
jgi:uncharacterized membrane protein